MYKAIATIEIRNQSATKVAFSNSPKKAIQNARRQLADIGFDIGCGGCEVVKLFLNSKRVLTRVECDSGHVFES